LKWLNPETLNIRRTVQAFVDQSPIVQLIPIDLEGRPNQMIAYRTAANVLGVMMLPLDGNPYRSMAIIGHSNQVRTNFALK
jgi:hypothetical protein